MAGKRYRQQYRHCFADEGGKLLESLQAQAEKRVEDDDEQCLPNESVDITAEGHSFVDDKQYQGCQGKNVIVASIDGVAFHGPCQ